MFHINGSYFCKGSYNCGINVNVDKVLHDVQRKALINLANHD